MVKDVLTPVIKYWNLKANPFKDIPLSDDTLEQFVCREEEIADE